MRMLSEFTALRPNMNRHMQTSRTADQHIKIKPLHLIFWIIVLQLIIAFFTDGLIFTHEEAMWHYIGRNWLRFGLTPYAGGVDNKSPLIYFIFGISDRLFGVNDWFAPAGHAGGSSWYFFPVQDRRTENELPGRNICRFHLWPFAALA